METNLISMDPAKAREAWQNYRAAIKHKHTKEDEILLRGYKHLAKGKKILDLIDVMQTAGIDNLGRPRLAIARASWEMCWLYKSSSTVTFSRDRWTSPRATHCLVNIPAQALPHSGDTLYNLKARVPSIPPRFKPAGSIDLYHILWDATWEQEPPHDPILLRHLGRNVYAVLASWDLSPLERALLR